MKKIIYIIVLTSLVSCVGTANSKAVPCGSNIDTNEIFRLIKKENGCLDCLLVDVDDELKRCPNDTSLNRIAIGVSIRMKKDGNTILNYYKSLPSLESLTSDEITAAAYYYEESGDFDNAIAAYEKAVSLRDDPFVRFSLAELQYKSNQRSMAVDNLEKLLKMTYPLPKTTELGSSSGSADALFDDASIFLAEIYASNSQLDKAEITYRNLLAAYKVNHIHYPDYLLMFSRTLAKSSNPEKIRESLALKAEAEDMLAHESIETRNLREELGDSWLRLPSELSVTK